MPIPFINDPWGSEALALRVVEIVAESEKAARERLAGFVPQRSARARRVHVATARGPAVEGILKYAAKHRVDLIVMGTHGRGAAGRLLLGSVAERVVRLSPVPVLTLHGGTPKGSSSRRRARH